MNSQQLYSVLYTRATSWLSSMGGFTQAPAFDPSPEYVQGVWEGIRWDSRIAQLSFIFSVTPDKVTEDVMIRLGFTEQQLKEVVK